MSHKAKRDEVINKLVESFKLLEANEKEFSEEQTKLMLMDIYNCTEKKALEYIAVAQNRYNRLEA